MDKNCEKAVESYLLNLNPLYAFSFPIGILMAIIVFGISKAHKWSDNTYIIQILLPILTLLITMILLEFISRGMINGNEKAKLVNKCKLWLKDPSIQSNPILSKIIDMELVLNYEEKIRDHKERFTNMNNNAFALEDVKIMEQHEEVVMPMEQNMGGGIFPQPIEYNKEINKCVENSKCYNKLPNMVAPIPGPNWIPESAETVQNRLKNNDYTLSTCEPN
jgi:hypothetical protein